jgi:hypothetical protein
MKPHYVTFEQAKLLKEKGFNEFDNNHYYDKNGVIFFCQTFSESYKQIVAGKGSNISAPEQWQVVQWLLEKYGVWIHVYYLTEDLCWGWDCYYYKNENGLINEPAFSFSMNLQSPQQAYSAAFDYILNNLLVQ